MTPLSRAMLPRVVRSLRGQPRHRSRSERATHKARSALLAGVVAFMAAQAGLNLAVRREWVPVRDPVWFEKFALLETHPEFFGPAAPGGPPRVLALGSSRTELGVAANLLAAEVGRGTGRPIAAFNFGCPAAGPMTAALYFRRLLAAGVRPDYLLVEIHPGFCSDLDPPYESRWLHRYRLRPDEVSILRGYGWAVEPPPHHGWRAWVSASAAYRTALVNHYAPVMLLCPYGLTVGERVNPDGWVAGFATDPADKPRALERTHDEYAATFADYQPGGPGLVAVRDVLGLARANGIRAAVLLMPESGEYRGWYGPAGFGRVGAAAAGVGRACGVPVVDAREWVADDGFADGHHLTAAGAKALSERLAGFVGPWVRGEK